MNLQEKTAEFSENTGNSSLALFIRNRVLAKLDGIKQGCLLISDPWGEVLVGEATTASPVKLTVHDSAFYRGLAIGGSNAVAATYRDGHWSCDNLTDLFSLFIRNIDQLDSMESGLARLGMWWYRRLHSRRQNTTQGSAKNIHDHYDLGNDLFSLFLDETMTYSAGIFIDESTSLKQASINKLDRICQKLDLNKNHRLIEIGTGWGSFALHAAKNYGCHITTTTISREQHELARQRIQAAGLGDRVDLLLCDYRDLTGTYDKLVSIEMIEAVGDEFLPVYFKQCAALLKPEGQMLLQAITMPDSRYPQYLKQTDFIQQFIFPGSCVPSLSAILNAVASATDFSVNHIDDIGAHYATTLAHWRHNFNLNRNLVLDCGYSEAFIRLWNYYLCYCEAGFRERYLGDLQILFNKSGCRAMPALHQLEQAQ